ncbi:MAG: large subunit ribosomal protein L21 [Candidatus Peregrinibacteria bacterium Gr01-1014_25]|nr:MAG: large subunit ribosomal protein L21 [Candidatus Peregrinibacteria bacterium Gr01-1014_25]
MFAVVDMVGFQEIAREGEKLHIPHLSAKEGATVVFDKVYLIAKDETVRVGDPLIVGAAVEVTVLGHGKDDKVRTVKFRRRKRRLKMQGHRQQYTEVEVKKIRA